MYVPQHFAVDDPDLLFDAMQAYSFAMLVSQQDGLPFSTHLPVRVTRDAAGALRIEGHLARANPHVDMLAGAEPGHTLAVFHGPHTYISPRYYSNEQTVPTWNYVAVHAYGTARLVDAPADKVALLERLIAANDPDYLSQFDGLEPALLEGMLRAIVGVQIDVTQVEGKFKLGQNRLPDHLPSLRASHEHGSAELQDLARWMRRLGHWT